MELLSISDENVVSVSVMWMASHSETLKGSPKDKVYIQLQTQYNLGKPQPIDIEVNVFETGSGLSVGPVDPGFSLKTTNFRPD